MGQRSGCGFNKGELKRIQDSKALLISLKQIDPNLNITSAQIISPRSIVSLLEFILGGFFFFPELAV